MNAKQVKNLCWSAGILLAMFSFIICAVQGVIGLAETKDEVEWLMQNDAIPDCVTKYYASALLMIFAICFILIVRMFFMTRTHIREIEKLKEKCNKEEEQ